MWSPHDHAADLGIEVIYANIDERGRYYPGENLILLQPGMHAIVERCTLAHELGHHHRGPSEDRADQWAADFLIHPEAVAQCAIEHPEHPDRWADQLNVTPRMLRVWLSDHANYVRAEHLNQHSTESRTP